MRLLLAEDNARVAALIAEGLGDEGFALDWFGTLGDARHALETIRYDLVLLDLGMPDGDGVAFVRAVRRSQNVTPILVITARSGLDDRVTGLDAGADDYLIKPFEIPELAARCRALLRRPGGCLGTILTVANLEFSSAEHEARVAGHPVRLSPRELALLEYLMRRVGRVVAKASLEEAVYSLASEVTPNALEAVVSRLRRKLADSGAAVTVHTAYGIGYMLSPAAGSAYEPA
ncbi:MAG: response regulator transcription factor [Acidiphilium sp.]|nr:response regulator transcription factor [Acidiphilium sp.]MDD4936753.1 response regulator transcription factor [Acidiphilium sp.]